MGKYFTVEVSPAFNATSVAAFGAGNLLFDWTAFQIPKGPAKLVSLGVIMRGTDGGVQTAKDIDFYFGKSINGVAPTSFGTVHDNPSVTPAIMNNIIGMTSIDATGDVGAANLQYGNVGQTGSGAAGSHIPSLILQGEPATGDNVGYDTIYIGAVTAGTLNFSTGVITSQTVDVSELSAAQLVNADIEGTDPRLVFAVGDIIHATDNIILGEIESMADANTITFKADGSSSANTVGAGYTVPADLAAWKIQNGAGSAGDLASSDELFNVHPMKIILSFEK